MIILLLFTTASVVNAIFPFLHNYHGWPGNHFGIGHGNHRGMGYNEPKEVIKISVPQHDHCKPVCPCYMDGVFYDYGDKWQRKGDPCTTYQCFHGYYIPVIRGASYKGKCKNIHETWTEGCFTYRVEAAERGGARYRLVEGGCDNGYGDCLKVGDQTTKNCNLYECQIVGSCYSMVLISKGCAHGGECQHVNSYWHDGCSVYQCMEFDGKTNTEKLYNELMYWPEGNYGLLKPKTGCPIDVDEEWSEGSRGHIGNGHNYKSFEFDAFGIYQELYFVHHFCIRQQVRDPSILPRYQTYWEPGQYCILRKNGTCPERFKEGYVQMDDMDGLEHLNSINGTLPDGNYTGDTLIYFCCRSDGKLEIPIVLPKQRSFILFVDKSAGECQEVRGMSHKLEYFAFDDRGGSSRTLMNGSFPLTKIGDNTTEIYFCHYRPMSCGCTDDDGNTVAVGKTIKKDCAVYTCNQIDGRMIFTVDKGMGGCLDENKKCQHENSTWVMSSGESCDQKRCVRVDNGVNIVFNAKTDFTGCKDGEHCRPTNYQINRGCYRSVCSAYYGGRRSGCRFRMQKAGCNDGKGGCVPLGKEYKRNCITYKCSAKTTACGLKFVKGGCNWKGKCREIGEKWNHIRCQSLHCSMNKTRITISTVLEGCYHRNKCYQSGYKLKEGCALWQCKVDNEKRQAFMDVIDGGCSWKGKCIGVNVTWKDGCNQYTCKWVQKLVHNHRYHAFTASISERRCAFKDECLGQGETRRHNCQEYECIVTSHDFGGHTIMKPIKKGCMTKDGNCLGLNERIEMGCVEYKCIQGPQYLQLTADGGAGCNVKGVCKAEGSLWTDKSLCVDFKCVKKINGGRIEMTVTPFNTGCLYKGICHPHGEKWISGVCREKQCISKTLPKNTFSRQIKTLPTGCMINGVCQPFNYTSTKGCIEYKCLWDHYRQTATYRYTKAGCKEVTSDKCHDIGDVWTEHKGSHMCLKMNCQKIGNNLHTGHEKIMCRDADGNCISIGKNFVALSRDGRKMNCLCKGTGTGISMSCSMPESERIYSRCSVSILSCSNLQEC